MKFAALLILSVIVFSPTLCIGAEGQKSRELSAVKTKIQHVDNDIKNLAAEKAFQVVQLRKLDQQYGELSDALLDLKQEIRQKEDDLKIVRNKIAATQKNIQLQQHSLEMLIKAVYAMGVQKGFQVLLNQHDPSTSGRVMVYHDYIARARLQKLQAIQENFKVLQQLETEQDAESRVLQVSLDKKKQETDDLQALKIQREKLVAQLHSDYLSKKNQMDRLRQDEKKLESLVVSFQKTDDNVAIKPAPPIVAASQNQRQPPQTEPETSRKQQNSGNVNLPGRPFAELQGLLPWPVQGAISEHFGHPRFETTWDGVVISAREGADIHAVAPGRVVFADWFQGYGLMLIVNHGNGFMSVFAYNQSLHKAPGDQVKTGDILASVGKSGGRTQAGLYFAIRKNGRALNPEHWFKKAAKE